MELDFDTWYPESFYYDELPSWPCPQCGSPLIPPKPEEIDIVETHYSLNHAAEPEDKRGRFHMKLICPALKGDCMDVHIHVLGGVRWELMLDEPITHKAVLYPHWFEPPLKIFPIAWEYPWEVEEGLERAFALYWADRAACANVLRTVVEGIMDDQKIRKTKDVRGGRRMRRSLHDRLEEFKQQREDVATLLMAMKWIGNTGSHQEEVDPDVLFEGLRILELALRKLYLKGQEEEVMRNAREISKRKGR